MVTLRGRATSIPDDAPQNCELSVGDLVRRIQVRRDSTTYAELVRRHEANVRAWCRPLLGCDEDAADVAQEVFLKVYFAIDGLRDPDLFAGWLHRITRRHCLDHLRRTRRYAFVELDDPAVVTRPEMRRAPDVESCLVTRRRAQLVRTSLSSMRESHRVPLVLREVEGARYVDIARTMGLGLSATKMRIKRARKQFADQFLRHAHGGREGARP